MYLIIESYYLDCSCTAYICNLLYIDGFITMIQGFKYLTVNQQREVTSMSHWQQKMGGVHSDASKASNNVIYNTAGRRTL